jgi:hypothetical protein
LFLLAIWWSSAINCPQQWNAIFCMNKLFPNVCS